MTTIDFVIIGVSVFALITGFRKGLASQLGVLVGILAGIMACRMFGDACARWIEKQGYLSSFLSDVPDFLSVYAHGILSALLLFVAGFLLSLLAAKAIKILVKSLSLGFVDSCLGAAFSFFTWFLALSVFLNVCQAFKTDGSVIDKATLNDGKVAKAVLDLAPKTFGIATATIKQNIENE